MKLKNKDNHYLCGLEEDKYETYSVQSIEYDNKGDICSLAIEDRKGNPVFAWKKKGVNPPRQEPKQDLTARTYKQAKDGDYIPF